MAVFYKRYYLKTSQVYCLLEDFGLSRAEADEGLSKAEETVGGGLRIQIGGAYYKIRSKDWGSWVSDTPDKRVFRLTDHCRQKLKNSGASLQAIRKAEAERKLGINIDGRNQYILNFGNTFRPIITDPRKDWAFTQDNDGEAQ